MVECPKARIVGLGTYIPERILKNCDLEKMVDTSDEWITTRTGIKERRIAGEGEVTSDMGAAAAQAAIADAGIDPKEIDLILVATVTPDHLSPSTASIIQAKINAPNAAAFDAMAACSGYLYGLSIAKAYIQSGMYRNILLVASEKMSAFVDYTDRNTCVLFGDGAAAAVIRGWGAGFLIRDVTLGSDGTQAELIGIPAGGSKYPASDKTVSGNEHFWRMNGKEVFKNAVRKMAAAGHECLKNANIEEKDIKWMIPHQANYRIVVATAKKFGIPMEQVYITLQKYGNCSAPSVALALQELIEQKTLQSGDKLLLVAFGAGLTWGAAALEQHQE